MLWIDILNVQLTLTMKSNMKVLVKVVGPINGLNVNERWQQKVFCVKN